MSATIQNKMRCAGVAYQYFLIAVNTEQDCIDQAREVFVQHFDFMASQLRSIEDLPSDKDSELLKNSLELQVRIQKFSSEFECFYFGAFKQFKEQHAVLIAKDLMMAFNKWLQMFDNEYLKFIRQGNVCREYAGILVAVTQLSQQLQNSEQVA